MLKKINLDEKEECKVAIESNLEELGFEMQKIIGLSFFDDASISHKVFQTSSKYALDQEETIISKFTMFASSSVSKEPRKKTFVMTQTGFYKLKEQKPNVYLCSYMPFEKSRMIVLENEKTQNNKPFLYGFHFFRCQKSYHMFTNEQELFKQIHQKLIYKTIQHTFHEEYEVKKLIGKGSFAKVYYATKRQTNDEYAIKAFSKEGLSSQENGREGLLNEIDVMRCLSHKNILKLYEVYETEHSIYLVIDLLSGGELISRIQANDQDPSFLDIAFLIKNLLEALAHMHKQGIMHRDIKPENLLLRDSSNIYDIVLADFGLSTKINQPIDEILFKRCGTPGFVAPEILAYKEDNPKFYNEKCDIFSVGALFYLLLTGQKLFKGDNCIDVLKENKACEIDFEGEELDGVPELAIDLLGKMLAASPEKRISALKALGHKYFEAPMPTKSEIKLTNLKHYRNMSPVSPHKQGNSPIVMKKSILTGKCETIETVEASTISPKKGMNHLLKKNNVGFSDFTEDLGKKNNKAIDKKASSPLKKISEKK